jgi:outer membrane protein, heavy metal efflux system
VPDTTSLTSGAMEPSPGVTQGDGAPRRPATPLTSVAAVPPSGSGTPLQIAAAEATLEAQESNLSLAHREVLAQPSIQAGVSYGDPLQPFLLPTVGISIPLPLFSRSGGEIAMASADRDRAEAEVEVARRQSAAQVAQSRRELRMALARVDRDRQLLSLAQRVVAGSLTAFAEGATALPSVLEAQRSARDALGQYVDDLAAADMAAAAVRLFILSAPPR